MNQQVDVVHCGFSRAKEMIANFNFFKGKVMHFI